MTMNRDKAIELLNSGPDGVREWNEYRKSSETIPDLSDAYLDNANLSHANLSEADLGGAICHNTVFALVDLSNVKGLKTIRHRGRSAIDVHTLYESQGKIPEVFLHGCGLVPWEIENAKLYQPALSAAEITDIQYKVFDLRTGPILSGSFISYSHDDSDFVAVLDKKLRKEGGNVWLDKHQFIAGSVEQNIDRAIRMNDIVILVLSKTSLASDWVWDEIKSAFEKETKQNRRVLCPIAVDDACRRQLTKAYFFRRSDDRSQNQRHERRRSRTGNQRISGSGSLTRLVAADRQGRSA